MKTKKAVYLTIAVLLASLLISIILSWVADTRYNKKKNITVVFYNVENLFDTVNNQGNRDGEFTPDGANNWTQERYEKKIDNIANVIRSVNKNEIPEIVGLAEVENRNVLNDLISSVRIKEANYRIEHFESPDFRGIDCALLYRPDEFKIIKSTPVRVVLADDPDFKTRDILYVKGETTNNEVFHIFVNHWPSRIGGEDQTEPKRIAVARLLKNKIDSVLNVNSGANIHIMGDMNDEPSNKSISEILGAKSPKVTNAKLVNLMYPDFEIQKGSYLYQGKWNMLDNIMVSNGLLDNKGFGCREKKGFIFHEAWMEFKNRNGEISPNRTYGGKNYYGGVSDHFPVYMQLTR